MIRLGMEPRAALGVAALCTVLTAPGCSGGDEPRLVTTGGTSPSGGQLMGGSGGTGGVGAAPLGGAVPTGGGSNGAATSVELVNADGWMEVPELGLQGAFYLFGDGITCNVAEGNPCTAEGCCLDWTTIVDSSFLSWGCGLGMELNATGGEDSTKRPYTAGAILGFEVTLSDVSNVRLGYTQAADNTDTVSPFVPNLLPEGNTFRVLFADTVCPSWGAEKNCQDGSVATSSHDLQVQVVGGEREGAGRLCITSVRPIPGL